MTWDCVIICWDYHQKKELDRVMLTNKLMEIMVKYFILILVIFVFVSCKQNNNSDNLRPIDTSPTVSKACFDSAAVDSLRRAVFASQRSKDAYYYALLKKWQNSANWQEQGPIDSIMQKTYVCSSEVYYIVSQAIRERYRFQIHPTHTPIEYTAVGKQKEYWLVLVRRPIMQQEIWTLISRINKDVLSMEGYHTGKHEYIYQNLLVRWLSSCLEQQWSDDNKNIYKDIDSVAAITIATIAATKHYGLEMLPIGAKSMGIYKEHWIVYCFPIRPPETANDYTSVAYYDSTGAFIGDFGAFMRHPNSGYGNCYWEALNMYVHGGVFLGTSLFESRCPPIVAVLISKENGQVLFMRECWGYTCGLWMPKITSGSKRYVKVMNNKLNP
jgi:hypothetical protein